MLPTKSTSKNGGQFHIKDVRKQQFQTKFQMESKPVHIRRANTGESKTIFSRETAFTDLQTVRNTTEATKNSRMKQPLQYIQLSYFQWILIWKYRKFYLSSYKRFRKEIFHCTYRRSRESVITLRF